MSIVQKFNIDREEVKSIFDVFAKGDSGVIKAGDVQRVIRALDKNHKKYGKSGFSRAFKKPVQKEEDSSVET